MVATRHRHAPPGLSGTTWYLLSVLKSGHRVNRTQFHWQATIIGPVRRPLYAFLLRRLRVNNHLLGRHPVLRRFILSHNPFPIGLPFQATKDKLFNSNLPSKCQRKWINLPHSLRHPERPMEPSLDNFKEYQHILILLLQAVIRGCC